MRDFIGFTPNSAPCGAGLPFVSPQCHPQIHSAPFLVSLCLRAGPGSHPLPAEATSGPQNLAISLASEKTLTFRLSKTLGAGYQEMGAETK